MSVLPAAAIFVLVRCLDVVHGSTARFRPGPFMSGVILFASPTAPKPFFSALV